MARVLGVLLFLGLLSIGLRGQGFWDPWDISCPTGPCQTCILGVCYDPPPIAVTHVNSMPIGDPPGVAGPSALPPGSPVYASPAGRPSASYPSVPLYTALMCPNGGKVYLFGSPGFGGPDSNGNPPGTPTGGGGGSPPVPPPGPHPVHGFYCYSNALNPYGPHPIPGEGAWPVLPGLIGPPPPTGGGGLPSGGGGEPVPLGPPNPNTDFVPFGPEATGALRILMSSGAFDECICDPATSPPPAGTRVAILRYNGIKGRLIHLMVSNGDGTYNSKNGTTPHTEVISWIEVSNIYVKPGDQIRCFKPN